MGLTKLVNLLLAISFASPIWPLGHNPTVGDPFIIVNKATNQLAYIHNGEIIEIYNVATGKELDLTPEGKFTITVKAKNPYYRKKDIPGGTEENPLGTRWMGFDAANTDGRIFGIHGNNNPVFIGKYVTNGCVRMFEKDVQNLFDVIPLGTKVLITNSDATFLELGKAHGAIRN
jgi:lipoprotein-anchoring transpeptidase ErfK/SrfK